MTPEHFRNEVFNVIYVSIQLKLTAHVCLAYCHFLFRNFPRPRSASLLRRLPRRGKPISGRASIAVEDVASGMVRSWRFCGETEESWEFTTVVLHFVCIICVYDCMCIYIYNMSRCVDVYMIVCVYVDSINEYESAKDIIRNGSGYIIRIYIYIYVHFYIYI